MRVQDSAGSLEDDVTNLLARAARARTLARDLDAVTSKRMLGYAEELEARAEAALISLPRVLRLRAETGG
jgi:hypothetical protein